MRTGREETLDRRRKLRTPGTAAPSYDIHVYQTPGEPPSLEHYYNPEGAQWGARVLIRGRASLSQRGSVSAGACVPRLPNRGARTETEY